MSVFSEERLLHVKQSLFIPPDVYAEELFNSIFPDKQAEKDMLEESDHSSKSAKTTTAKIQTRLDKLFLSSDTKPKTSDGKESPLYFPVKKEILLSEINGLENIMAAIGESIKAEPDKWSKKDPALSQETSKVSSKSKKVKVSTHKRIFSHVKVKNNTSLFAKSSQSSQNSEYSTPQRLPTVYTHKDLM